MKDFLKKYAKDAKELGMMPKEVETIGNSVDIVDIFNADDVRKHMIDSIRRDIQREIARAMRIPAEYFPDSPEYRRISSLSAEEAYKEGQRLGNLLMKGGWGDGTRYSEPEKPKKIGDRTVRKPVW